jgi:hypothetical protein
MDGTATDVVVHLSLPSHVSDFGRPLTGERAAGPDPIEQGLEAALDSLWNILEGTGGKEQPETTAWRGNAATDARVARGYRPVAAGNGFHSPSR